MSTEDAGSEADAEGEDPLEAIREAEESVEEVAEREDRLGADARVLLALSRDEYPDTEDLERSHFPSGSDSGAYGDSLTGTPWRSPGYVQVVSKAVIRATDAE